MVNVGNFIEQAKNETIQSIPNISSGGNNVGGGVLNSSLLLVLAKVGDIISQWWSTQRDFELRNFWKKSDHLSGAIYAMSAKMTTIPFRVIPKDASVPEYVELAEQYTQLLYEATQFGEGWQIFFAKWLEDYVGQDNGAFFEIIGAGDKTQSIEGAAISISNLDASQCTRTGDFTYPVVYTDEKGLKHKLHYTRVSYVSQMPSAKASMLGIGFSSISRAVNSAQILIDISTYKQEKLGSRPQRQLMITGGGLDPEDLKLAIEMANKSMDNSGLSRFSKTVAVGNRAIDKPTVQTVDLASLPDGFDEKWSTVSGMAIIALAFGIEARELFPLMMDSAGKADAVIQHIKQRGKSPGQIIEIMETQLGQKFLPPFLKLSFDYQDDSQDRQVAEIRGVRAVTRERNLGISITNPRVERELMLENSEITEAQFEMLELEDGRLIDGCTTETLFYSKDRIVTSMLKGITEQNCEDYEQKLLEIIATSSSRIRIKRAKQCLSAIEHRYNEDEEEEVIEPETNSDTPPKPDEDYNDGEKYDSKRPKPITNNDRISNYYTDGKVE